MSRSLLAVFIEVNLILSEDIGINSLNRLTYELNDGTYSSALRRCNEASSRDCVANCDVL